jgi:hypothetical protein
MLSKNRDQQRQYGARQVRERETQRDVSREQQKKNRGRSR